MLINSIAIKMLCSLFILFYRWSTKKNSGTQTEYLAYGYEAQLNESYQGSQVNLMYIYDWQIITHGKHSLMKKCIGPAK